MRQFMSEAVMLTGTGGIAIAIIPTVSPSIPGPDPDRRPGHHCLHGELDLGVLAGSYPANRAAWMRPIQALRFE